MYLANTSLALH